MPCLSGRFDSGIGPLITVVVRPVRTENDPPIKRPHTAFQALIDTGASATCISPTVAQDVGLQPIGKRQMISATHAIPVNVYLVDLIISFGTIQFVESARQVMEFSPPEGSRFQMLVGMDIIRRGSLSINFDGHFTFCL